MQLFMIDIRVCGTALVRGTDMVEATSRLETMYPICLDVNDLTWFEPRGRARLATGMTIYGPVPGQTVRPVTRAAMIAAMRPSVRGEKTFWIPFARSGSRYGGLKEYSIDIMMVATAFVSAENADDAAALFKKSDQLTVDMEQRGIWFFAEGLDGSSFPMVLSPMMAITGPVEGAELSFDDEEIQDGEADPQETDPDSDVPDRPAALTAYDQTSFQTEAPLKIDVPRLKEILMGWGLPFADIADEEAREIMLVLKDHFDRRTA